MNILAFDTCLGAVSVAVRRLDGSGRWEMHRAFEPRDQGHAERLMPMIAETMQQAGLKFSDLDRVAVTLGPGTFTGVRGGVAAARGLALASGKAITGTTSLAVMAYQADQQLGATRGGRMLAVTVDARRGSLYVQLFADGWNAAGGPQLLSASEAAAAIGSRPVVIVGSGAKTLLDAVLAVGGGHADAETLLTGLQPDASALAVLASDLPLVSPLRPLYLRPPDAKAQAAGSLPRAVA